MTKKGINTALYEECLPLFSLSHQQNAKEMKKLIIYFSIWCRIKVQILLNIGPYICCIDCYIYIPIFVQHFLFHHHLHQSQSDWQLLHPLQNIQLALICLS